GMGLLMSLDPVIAQALGAADHDGVARGVQRGMVLAVVTGLLAIVAMAPVGPLLRLGHQPPEVIPGATAYIWWSMLGVIPWQVFTAFRQTLQAMHRVLPMAIAVIVSNLLNAFLNWVFVFGHLGFRSMGVVGSAHATWISRWVMLLLVVWFSWPYLRTSLVPWHRASFRVRPLMRMAAIGLPVGFQMFAESFAFGFGAIAMGWFGAVALAGHQVTLIMAALTFMVPMGVAGAGAAMVGRAIGRNDIAAARRDSAAALVCGVGFMAVMAALFLLLPIAGVFQIFDGTQVVSASILRGTGDTHIPMVLHALSFWAVGIPLGLLLAFPLKVGPTGLWWGLTAGLASAAVLQVARVRSRLSRDVSRVVVD